MAGIGPDSAFWLSTLCDCINTWINGACKGKKKVQFLQSNERRPRARKSSSKFIAVQISVGKTIPFLVRKKGGRIRSIQFLQSNKSRPRTRKSSSQLIIIQMSAKKNISSQI